jgi:hypothetical protein
VGYNIWAEVREAKHRWSGADDFRVTVRDVRRDIDLVERAEGRTGSAEREGEPTSGLTWDRESDIIELSLTASAVSAALERDLETLTTVVVDAVLEQARLAKGVARVPAGVHLVVSGRGAAFPGIQGRIEALSAKYGTMTIIDEPKVCVSLGALEYAKNGVSTRDEVRSTYLVLGQDSRGNIVVKRDLVDGGPEVVAPMTGCAVCRIVREMLPTPAGLGPTDPRRFFLVDLPGSPFPLQGWQREKMAFRMSGGVVSWGAGSRTDTISRDRLDWRGHGGAPWPMGRLDMEGANA